ncbi:hypothetical protein Plhal304r1_c091g0171511 [Plasmopara halstedii]
MFALLSLGANGERVKSHYRFPWTDVVQLFVNTGGIKQNGRKFIKRVITQYNIVVIQET